MLDADMLSSREGSLIKFFHWLDGVGREIYSFASRESDAEVTTVGTNIAYTSSVSEKPIGDKSSYHRQ